MRLPAKQLKPIGRASEINRLPQRDKPAPWDGAASLGEARFRPQRRRELGRHFLANDDAGANHPTEEFRPMARSGHGSVSPTQVTAFKSAVAKAKKGLAAKGGPGAPTKPGPGHFGYMFSTFPGYKGQTHLEESEATVANLKALAAAMSDPAETGAGDPNDSGIPAGFTYLGQFIDHDVTLETASMGLKDLAGPKPAILAPEAIALLMNSRSAGMELDSVYFSKDGDVDPEARDGQKMLVEPVSNLGGAAKPLLRPAGKADRNDLPRRSRDNDDPFSDREAIIGDPRNDENTVIAQLHTAFLKAHNALLADGAADFAAARVKLIKIYQTIALNEYLDKICGVAIAQDVRANGPKHFNVASDADLFMPLEFSAAAFRFGHSMVRTAYDFNLNFNRTGQPGTIPATLGLLFAFTALSGQLTPSGNPVPVPPGTGTDNLPENWIIEWQNFVQMPGQPAPQMARKIDTMLTSMLFQLRNTLGGAEKGHTDEEIKKIADGQAVADPPPHVMDMARNLATRNLLRGYVLKLPTGQTVARAMGLQPLEGAAFLNALPASQRTAAAPFQNAAPLWFYILAEAGNPAGPNGMHLGPVGGRIVAECIWRFIRHAPVSILKTPDPSLAGFTLAKLVELAGKQDQPGV
jgi:Animal haem peroxidase